MNTDQRLRDSRVTEALDRLRRRHAVPWPLRLLSSAGMGSAFAVMAAAGVPGLDGDGRFVAALVSALLALGVLALIPASRGLGTRSASGAVSEPRWTRGRTVGSLAVPLGLVLPVILLDGTDLVDSVPAVVLLAAALTAVVYASFPYWLGYHSSELPVPSRVADDPLAAAPEVAALVAVLYDNADLRSDVAARLLEVDDDELRDAVDSAVDAGLVRSRDDLRRVQDAAARRAAGPREQWLALTTVGRSLLVFD